MMNPIQIEAIPQGKDLELWRIVEKRLNAFDDCERIQVDNGEIDNRDRYANKVLFYACDYVRRGDWLNLWLLLLERQAIALYGAKKKRAYNGNPRKRTICNRTKKAQIIKALPELLTDKWQTVDLIVIKYHAIHPECKFKRFDDYLKEIANSGLCTRYKPSGDKLVYYANCEATEFDYCWLPRSQAMLIAIAKGYNLTPDYFAGSAYKFDRLSDSAEDFYRKFGLEFRSIIPEGESNICKWRVLR